MFILMSLETGFDHNHFGEKDIIVLFWLFHSNIESFRVFTAFFLLREFKIKYRTELISKISEDPASFRENLKFRSCFGKNFESCHCSILTYFNSFRHLKLMSRNICYCDQRENLTKLHLWSNLNFLQKLLILQKNSKSYQQLIFSKIIRVIDFCEKIDRTQIIQKFFITIFFFNFGSKILKIKFWERYALSRSYRRDRSWS